MYVYVCMCVCVCALLLPCSVIFVRRGWRTGGLVRGGFVCVCVYAVQGLLWCACSSWVGWEIYCERQSTTFR